MADSVRAAVCKQRNSNLFTVWTGPTEYRLKLGKCTFTCPVHGCGADLDVVQIPSTGVVYIHPHKCVSKCIHAAAMRAWCERYLVEARFITRVCPLCETTPARVTKHSLPLPHVEIYGSCLLVHIHAHSLKLVVNFRSNWPSEIPCKDAIRLRHFDPIGDRCLTTGAFRSCDQTDNLAYRSMTIKKVSQTVCDKCALVMPNERARLAVPVFTEQCTVCDEFHTPHMLGAATEVPVPPRSVGSRRRFEVNGVVHVVLPASSKRCDKTRGVNFVWQIPQRPNTTLRLVHGAIARVSKCSACAYTAPSATPPPPEESIDELVEHMLATCIDDIDPDPDKRTCFICTVAWHKSELSWHDQVPSAHLLKDHPDGCYICGDCLVACSNCGDPALPALDPLCTRCAAAE